jgi:HrpA-like RNA helicase
LPITEHRERILEAIASAPVTVIGAETGAGKSSQVPQVKKQHNGGVIVF